ncbi:hypothetical protein LCGC14_1872960 [marine sediment metagenome]|uniref:Uncharacterized protein n=1 Tax=marine sediment metagenome TaxID=412755 RepID=A0A0F9J367_9ZZZZ
MWEMKRAEDEEEAAKFLEEGWEPFSMEPTIRTSYQDGSPANVIVHKAMWFKRIKEAK